MNATNSTSTAEMKSQGTLLNANSALDAAFDDANEATSRFLTALTKTDNALYRALRLIYEFVKAGETRPEEFEEFKRAKGIKRNHNAKSIFQPYVKYFIEGKTDATEIIGRASKYGAVLDEASEQGISFDGFSEWIKSRGIENICKERRRRYREQKPKPTLDAVVEATDAERADAAIPSPECFEPSFRDDLTIRHVLKLSAQAEQCSDPEERQKIEANLDKLASTREMDRHAFVEMAEQHVIIEAIRKWGDEPGREIGRLCILLHRHGISY